MSSLDEIRDQLDNVAEELANIEAPDDAYKRGYADGLSKGKDTLTFENWFVSMAATFATTFVFVAIIVGVWNFIHWASDHPENVKQTVCMMGTGGIICQ